MKAETFTAALVGTLAGIAVGVAGVGAARVVARGHTNSRTVQAHAGL